MASSAGIGADGSIYFGSADGKLYALNPNGSQEWSFTTDGPIFSSPAIGADGTIYAGSYDRKLYAVCQTPADYWPVIGTLIVAVVVAGLVIFFVRGIRPAWFKSKKRAGQAQNPDERK